MFFLSYLKDAAAKKVWKISKKISSGKNTIDLTVREGWLILRCCNLNAEGESVV